MYLPPNKTKKANNAKPSSEIFASALLLNAVAKRDRQCSVGGEQEVQVESGQAQPLSSPVPAVSASAAMSADKNEKDSTTMNQRTSCKRRKLNASASAVTTTMTTLAAPSLPLPLPDISLRKLIPPKDCPRIRRRLQYNPNNETETLQQQLMHAESHQSNTSNSQPSVPLFDWSAVIARARSHPHEAAESYYGPMMLDTDSFSSAADIDYGASSSNKPSSFNNDILTYKPLHGMLKYDPPLDAVEAVLRAHPEAALDVTFEGSALKIAAECNRVSSMLVLRLLLVAEMAMRKKMAQEQQQQQQQEEQQQQEDQMQLDKRKDEARQQQNAPFQRNNSNDDDILAQQQQQQQASNMFYGHNPIQWITERSIPVKTAAMLLKWYPNGAFQRSPYEDDVSCYSSLRDDIMDEAESTSPLIEIIDDFARDHYAEDTEDTADNDDNDEEGYNSYDSETDYDDDEMPSSERQSISAAITAATTTPAATSEAAAPEYTATTAMQPQTYHQRQHVRQEKRWEKFLHILYATDLTLQSIRPPSPHSTTFAKENNGGEASCSSTLPSSNAAASAETATAVTTELSTAASADPSLSKNNESLVSESAAANAPSSSPMTPPPATATSNNPTKSQPKTTPQFRPVHAFLRCLTTPHCNLGLHNCRPYGAWSVLRVMVQRVPSEFAKRDAGDGDRTAFQTLAESDAQDCELCLEEVKDVVECLMDADYRSAFLPRKSDGRLIGHVALENGWPCKDLFSRKTSATCA